MRRLKSYSRSSLRFASVSGQKVLNSHQQLRSLVLKRLQRGDVADLFSIPEEDAGKHEFVWYTNLAGTITPFEALPAEQRSQREADLQAKLAALQGLAQQIRTEASSDRRSLEAEIIEAALKIPDDTCKFMVGDQPVLAAWGASLVKSSRASVDVVWTEPAPGRAAASKVAVNVGGATSTTATTVGGESRPWSFAWLRNFVWLLPLLAGVLLVALFYKLGSANLDLNMSRLIPSFATPPPRLELDKNADLRREISDLNKQLLSKLDSCPRPLVPRDSAGRGVDNQGLVLKMPEKPTTDLSFLKGCWQTEPFKHRPDQTGESVSTYCFDERGEGWLENSGISSFCRPSARARYSGDELRIDDSDCLPIWAADHLVCRRAGDGVALCSGVSQLAMETVRWTVRLHRVR